MSEEIRPKEPQPSKKSGERGGDIPTKGTDQVKSHQEKKVDKPLPHELVKLFQEKQQAGRDHSNSALGPEVTGSTFIGEYLFELWKNQCLCDVRLQCGNCSYLAHKIVLAAFSELFCPSTTNIPPTVCVEVPGTTPEALYQVLQYLYTSEMEMTDSSLEPIINAACFMGVTDVVEMVKEILCNPTMENIELYIGIRKRFGMSATILDFIHLVRENFIEIVENEVFLGMKFEELEQLLEDPGVMVDTELDTLDALIKWIEYNPMGRMPHAGTLLAKISLECIDPNDLASTVEQKKHLFQDPKAQEVLMEAFKQLAMSKGAGEGEGLNVTINTMSSAIPSGSFQKAQPTFTFQQDTASQGTKKPWASDNFCSRLLGEMESVPCDRLDQTQLGPMTVRDGVRKTFNEIRRSFAAKRRQECAPGDVEGTQEPCTTSSRFEERPTSFTSFHNIPENAVGPSLSQSSQNPAGHRVPKGSTTAPVQAATRVPHSQKCAKILDNRPGLSSTYQSKPLPRSGGSSQAGVRQSHYSIQRSPGRTGTQPSTPRTIVSHKAGGESSWCEDIRKRLVNMKAGYGRGARTECTNPPPARPGGSATRSVPQPRGGCRVGFSDLRNNSSNYSSNAPSPRGEPPGKLRLSTTSSNYSSNAPSPRGDPPGKLRLSTASSNVASSSRPRVGRDLSTPVFGTDSPKYRNVGLDRGKKSS